MLKLHKNFWPTFNTLQQFTVHSLHVTVYTSHFTVYIKLTFSTGARDGNICLWTIFDVEGFSTYEESCGIHRKTPIEILRTEGIVRIRDTHYNPVCEVHFVYCNL